MTFGNRPPIPIPQITRTANSSASEWVKTAAQVKMEKIRPEATIAFLRP